MVVSSSQEAGGVSGVWLRVRMSNSLVLSLRTTVRAMRVSLLDSRPDLFRETKDDGLGLG